MIIEDYLQRNKYFNGLISNIPKAIGQNSMFINLTHIIVVWPVANMFKNRCYQCGLVIRSL